MSDPKKIPVLASVPRIAGVAAVPSMSDTPSEPDKIKLILSPHLLELEYFPRSTTFDIAGNQHWRGQME